MNANSLRCCVLAVLIGQIAWPTFAKEVDAVTSPSPPAPRALVHWVGERHERPKWWYVITHGMGGTAAGDRFELLAREIKAALPDANVICIDWSADAKRGVFGVPTPWLVAPSIEPVALVAAEQLRGLVDPQRLTLIGESFGNDVNYGIAAELGHVARFLSFNPANELGGHGASDLRQHCDQAWAFHTRSPFDTRLAVSHRGMLLHTPRGLDAVGQHTYGMRWLRDRIAAGDTSWLLLDHEIPAAPTGLFDAGVLPDGTIDWELLPRCPAIDDVESTDAASPAGALQ